MRHIYFYHKMDRLVSYGTNNEMLTRTYCCVIYDAVTLNWTHLASTDQIDYNIPHIEINVYLLEK